MNFKALGYNKFAALYLAGNLEAIALMEAFESDAEILARSGLSFKHALEDVILGYFNL